LGALYAQLVDACVGVVARTPDGETVDRVLTCVADMVIPQLAHMVPDFERQVGVATHLMQQIISPALRAHMTGGYSGPAQATTQTQHFAAVLQSLAALAQQTSLAKVWRRDVWDFYGDAKFFSEQTMAPALAMHWKQLVRQLLVTDKDRVADLLSRIAASAPGLFANRVYEAQTFQEAFTMAEPDMEFIDALLMSDLMFLDFTAANSQSPVLSPAGFVSDFEL
ncbi:hypothetical protein IWW56_006588, partial [Coemansia sp. RSA 2131]